ncbi:hypothetical protein ACOMHN_043543 [Nucella lapillus]
MANTSLDMANTSLDMANTSLDMANTSLDMANTSLDMANTSLDMANTRASSWRTWEDEKVIEPKMEKDGQWRQNTNGLCYIRQMKLVARCVAV